MALSIEFLGGAGTVTGSRYLVRAKGFKILIDCGLFQGLKALRLKNWEDFPIDPSEIDAVILTHAHIDHSGYLPKLIKSGFTGKIYCSEATRDLCAILLPDSGHLMEEEADYLNKRKRSKHSPALALFTEKEAIDSLHSFAPVDFHQKIELKKGIYFELQNAGHILGASSVILNVDGKRVAFTGDVGRNNDPMLYPPENLPGVDYLITESTYGNRAHKDVDVLTELEQVVLQTYERQGVVLLPAFAVGRAQTLMYCLLQLSRQNRIPEIPIYLNSPMATDVTGLMLKYLGLHKLTKEDCFDLARRVKIVRSAEESKELNLKTGPMIIISASGMMTGGRILHHIKSFGPHEKNTILLTGFQAAGTRGEALLQGAEELKIHGEYVPIRAQVAMIDNMSAHADYKELHDWFASSKISPRKVFLTHGEPSAADELRRRLNESFGWNCIVPNQGDVVELT